jgi:predicted MFS family arabinose efflux permease
MLLALRGIQGLSTALIGLSISLFVDLFRNSKGQRLHWISINAAVLTVGLSVHPILSGLLGTINWRYSFIIFWIGIPTAIVAWFWIPDEQQHKQDTPYSIRDLLRIIGTIPAVAIYVNVFVVFIMIYMVVLYAFPITLHDSVGANALVISIYLSIGAVATTGATIIHGECARHVHNHWLYAFGIMTMSIGYIMLFASKFTVGIPRALLLSFGAVVYGVGEGLSIPALTSGITLLPNFNFRYQTTCMNLWVSISRAGQICGPVVASVIYHNYDVSITIMVSAAIGIVAAVGVALIYTLRYLQQESTVI